MRSFVLFSLLILALSSTGVLGQPYESCCDDLDCSGDCVNDSAYSCHCTLSAAAIALIVCGCVATIVIIIILCRRRRIRQQMFLANATLAQPIIYQQPGVYVQQPGVYVQQPAVQQPYYQGQAYQAGAQPQQGQGYVQQPQQYEGTYSQVP